MTTTMLRARTGAWWLHPAWAGALGVLPALGLTCLISDDMFREWWKTPKYFDSGNVLLTLVLLGALIFGCLLAAFAGSPRERPDAFSVSPAQAALIARAGPVLTAISLVGYIAWFGLAMWRGLGVGEIETVLTGDGGAYAAKGYLMPVAGVTTVVQFAPLAIVCLLLDRWISGRRHTAALLGLVTLGVVRATLNSERLGLMELLVPVLVLCAVVVRPGRERARPWLWACVPLLAPVAILLIFGAFEYVRSWLSFYQQYSGLGYGEFVVRRVLGYYVTSGNNTEIILSHLGPALDAPYYSIRFFWNLPVLSHFVNVSDVMGFDPSLRGIEMLRYYGNPEFNTMGGMPVVVNDYGVTGAMIWWAGCGFVLALCHRLLRFGDVRGLVLYPVVYVGLADLARLFYWGEGRAFPPLAGGLVLAFLLHRARARQAS